MSKDKKLIGVGLLTAIASSLCCITPVLALISGAAGISSTFSYLGPFRPYLIGLTVLALSFAWYQQLKPKKDIDCACEPGQKPSFLQSNLFLGMLTFFAITMTVFPSYSSVFYSTPEKEIMVVDKANLQTISLGIKGMTCTSCEEHINYAVNQLNGILSVNTSYENEHTAIEFDSSIVTILAIEKAINSTGYSVINTQ